MIFTPNWNKILTFDKVIITCEVGSTVPMDTSYHWYKDGIKLHTDHRSITINIAQLTNGGEYQCQAGGGKISDPVILDVTVDFVILQVPPFVYEGDSVHLRCRTYPGNTKEIRGVTFYKDEVVILSSLKDTDLHLDRVSMNDTGKYKCEKKLYYNPTETYSDEAMISVRELFSCPRVKMTMKAKSEGDPMTLTCDTSLSPHSQRTELEFSFYKDESSIQVSSSSNIYSLQYAELEDSGNYTCEVRSSTAGVWKRSNITYIQIYSKKKNVGQVQQDYTHSNIMRLLLSGIILIIGAVISCNHRKGPEAPPQ